ncbi:DUF3750 domain-containing protein [Mesorhizobium xinjiangense]|uniref:DUF3750 domain-containing protein n=1 Tax=Mesorhizobium xinjiangense TaxID=2678685 RepID=UPI0012ECD0EF|nr:DUF3750 domain-containing protein [Mesorhizobium xinjiangense]
MQRKGFSLRRALKILALFVAIVFILPTLATAAWWGMLERPSSWSTADWSASGVLPPAAAHPDAAVYLMAARTGGMKGAISVHSWIVFKRACNCPYERYDKVGWGSPVRRNAYTPDARWYSNTPEIVHALEGDAAAALIPRIEAAIASYPYSRRGDYYIWPGPNSNSFVAHVLRQVPEIDVVAPSNATGRDFAPGFAAVDLAPDWRDIHATLGGLMGFAAGARSGFEIHLFGLVAGIDFARPALKIPAYGRLPLFLR